MSSATVRLVLIVSLAHAMAHVFELSLSGVEQQIDEEFSAGTFMIGCLAATWRLPWGIGALFAGWLVDHFGGKRMLAFYLFGCGATSLVAGSLFSLAPMYPTMFLMGAFASIYHPAGLALISHETNPDNRPMALGIHGVFGSAGIGIAPLLAGGMLASGFAWRQYYWALAIPAIVLGLFFAWRALASAEIRPAREPKDTAADDVENQADWPAFFTLTVIAMTQGFVYAAITTFLPRYLSHSLPNSLHGFSDVGTGAMLAGFVLFLGCIGQILAGWFARASRLERQLTWIIFGNAPFLLWMSVARGWTSVVAAGGFTLVHFMHQPVYNSLIAKYTPRRRRSLCYGFSFAVGFGIGSLGAMFAGYTIGSSSAYIILAMITGIAGLLGVYLASRQ